MGKESSVVHYPPEEADHSHRPRSALEFIKRHKAETVRHTLYQKPKSCWERLPVFEPEHLFLWDIVVLMAMFFVAVVIPFEVAVVTKFETTLAVIGAFVDFVFFCDIFVQFNLAYENADGSGPERNRWKIVENYAKGWLIIDVISIMPVEAMSSFRETKLIKMFRLIRYGRIFDRWTIRLMRCGLLTQQLITTSLIVFLVAHLGACFWIMVGKDNSDGPGWVQTQEDFEGLDFSAWDLYGRSLHWSVMTLTTIGYGDIGTPVNTSEYYASAVFMLIIGSVWAFIIGTASSLGSLRNEMEMEFILILDDLNRFMRLHKFDPDLSHELRMFFLKDKDLRARQSGCVRELAMRVRFALFPPGEFIGKPNEGVGHSLGYMHRARRGAVMFIVVKGCVMVHGMKIVRKGGSWGEDMLLDSPHLRKNPSALSVSYVEVAMVQRHDLESVLKRHPEDRKIIRKKVLKMICVRGMLFLAKQARRKNGDMKLSDVKTEAKSEPPKFERMGSLPILTDSQRLELMNPSHIRRGQRTYNPQQMESTSFSPASDAVMSARFKTPDFSPPREREAGASRRSARKSRQSLVTLDEADIKNPIRVKEQKTNPPTTGSQGKTSSQLMPPDLISSENRRSYEASKWANAETLKSESTQRESMNNLGNVGNISTIGYGRAKHGKSTYHAGSIHGNRSMTANASSSFQLSPSGADLSYPYT
ncbi:hypothetical protein AAMO2058_001399700 [Amorphochlora amoebiformis]